MPKFRFVAVDSEGMFRDGTIEASDGSAARDKLAANGLKVRELHEVDAPSDSSAPLFSRGKPYDEESDRTPPPVPSAQDDYEAPRPRGSARSGSPSGKGTKVLAILALVLTLFSIVYICFTNPPWGRLSKYNFSSPEEALRSEIRMRLNGDVRARAELDTRTNRREMKQVNDSLKFEKTVEFNGKKAVFFQFTIKDRKTDKERTRKDVEWFEKSDSGYWIPSRVDLAEVREKDPKLAKEIEEWERSTPN